VLMVNDYYPFGLEMPGRSVNFRGYRYGFNGKEKDDKGEWGSTHYDYGFRIYNPQIAKFLSVDPLAASYPWYTPYQFAGNTPIQAIDLDGLEEHFHYLMRRDGKNGPKKVYAYTIYERNGNKIEGEKWIVYNEKFDGNDYYIFNTEEKMWNWDPYDLFGGFWKMPSNIFSRSEVFDAVVEIC
jgi:RHS repeat-associated protein